MKTWNKRDRHLIAVVVLIIAVVLIGEVYIYTFSAGTYGSSTKMSSDGVIYNVSSGSSNSYNVIVSDNGDFEPITEYYVYYDERYESNVVCEWQPIGSKALTESYYLSQLKCQLEYRGVTSLKTVDADELASLMREDVSSGNYSKGLIIISGAFPDTVYTGGSSDLIFSWMSGGGSLYWLGNIIGSCYSTQAGGLVDVSGYQTLFFGTEGCVNTDKDLRVAYSDITDNDYRYALSMMNNNVKYGVNAEMLSGGTLAIGYTEDDYSSIVFNKFGDGMICVLAGDMSNNQRADLAQIISSGLCYNSAIIGQASGTVTRGSVSGTVDMTAPSQYSSVYIYYGGYYPVYGRCYQYLGTDPCEI
jgi:hypothetical protein